MPRTAPRQQTPREHLCSDEEMDRRISELAARAGIGRGQVVVRHVEPTATPSERARARDAVLAALSNGKPTAAGYIAHVAGLSRPTVSTALRALAGDGLVVDVGRKRQAKGPRQRLWQLVEGRP